MPKYDFAFFRKCYKRSLSTSTVRRYRYTYIQTNYLELHIKGFHRRCFSVYFTKFFRTVILQITCEDNPADIRLGEAVLFITISRFEDVLEYKR